MNILLSGIYKLDIPEKNSKKFEFKMKHKKKKNDLKNEKNLSDLWKIIK